MFALNLKELLPEELRGDYFFLPPVFPLEFTLLTLEPSGMVGALRGDSKHMSKGAGLSVEGMRRTQLNITRSALLSWSSFVALTSHLPITPLAPSFV